MVRQSSENLSNFSLSMRTWTVSYYEVPRYEFFTIKNFHSVKKSYALIDSNDIHRKTYKTTKSGGNMHKNHKITAVFSQPTIKS